MLFRTILERGRFAAWGFVLVLTAVLSSCSPPGGGARTSKKNDVKFSAYESVNPLRTRYSLEGLGNAVADRLAERRGGLYREIGRLDFGGRIVYERNKTELMGRFDGVKEIVDRWGKADDWPSDIKIDPAMVRKEGQAYVFSGTSDKQQCTVILIPVDVPQVSEVEYQILTAAGCAAKGSTSDAKLESRLLDLAQRTRFDDGKLAKDQFYAAGAAKQDEKEKLAEEQLAAANLPGVAGADAIVIKDTFTSTGIVATIEGAVSGLSSLFELRVDNYWVNVDRQNADRFYIDVPGPPGRSDVEVVAYDKSYRIISKKKIKIERGAQAMDTWTPPVGRRYALIIGNNAYAKPLPTLDTPILDAQAVSAMLQVKFGFETQLIKDAKRNDILSALADYRKKLTPGDSLLIYYAGHGYLDEKRHRGYWLPVDADPSDSNNAWIANREIVDAVKNIPARRVLLVVDACFSGDLAQSTNVEKRPNDLLSASSTFTQLPADIGRVVTPFLRVRTTLSLGDLEVVDDLAENSTHSPFAKYFLSALETARGNSQVHDIARFVRDNVRKEADQTPQYRSILSAGHDSGADFDFVSASVATP